MSEEAEDQQSHPHALGIRQLIAGVWGTIFLGALGSGLWDQLFRPGLHRAGSFVTRMWTAADDAVFTSAAQDPRPIPELLLLLLLVQIPLWAATWLFFETFIRPGIRRRIARSLKATDISTARSARARFRMMLIGAGAFFLGIFILAQIGYSITNEAVLVWRLFHQNLTICSPYLLQNEEREIMAQFRMMQRRQDFEVLRRQLDAIAEKHELELKWYKR